MNAPNFTVVEPDNSGPGAMPADPITGTVPDVAAQKKNEDTPELAFHKAGTGYEDPQTEAILISACLNSSKALQACANLSTESFYNKQNLAVFRTMLDLAREGILVNSASVLDRLKSTLEDFGEEWMFHVNICASVKYEPSQIETYIQRLQYAERLRGETYCAHTYAESFCASLLLQKLPPCKCVGDDWYEYDMGAWTKTDKHTYRKLSMEVIHPRQRQSRRATEVLNQAETVLQVKKSIFSGGYKHEKDRILINVNNGTIEVEDPSGTVTFRPHDQEDFFSLKIAADYIPDAPRSLFEQTLAYALPDEEDRHLYQVFAGSALLPSCEHEAALVCYGQGQTGKSTIADAIAHVLGKGLCGSCGLEELCKPGSYSLPTLKQKMLNIGSELEGTEIATSASFKKLVSGENFSARAIYGKPEEMQTFCKMLFLTNHMPRFRGGTDAEARRLHFLHFDQVVEVKDPQLKGKLKEEASGILNWMLEGLVWLIQNNQMPKGGVKSDALLSGFNEINDPIRMFVTECCNLSGSVLKSALFEAFQDWCYGRGINAEKMENFFYKGLRERFSVKDSRIKLDSSKRQHFYSGIELRN